MSSVQTKPPVKKGMFARLGDKMTTSHLIERLTVKNQLAKKMLGDKFIFHTQVSQLYRQEYSKDQLRYLLETMPNEQQLKCLADRNYLLISRPAQKVDMFMDNKGTSFFPVQPGGWIMSYNGNTSDSDDTTWEQQLAQIDNNQYCVLDAATVSHVRQCFHRIHGVPLDSFADVVTSSLYPAKSDNINISEKPLCVLSTRRCKDKCSLHPASESSDVVLSIAYAMHTAPTVLQ